MYMLKVCLQSGHKGITIGATGAPGERDWTQKIVPLIAKKLKTAGCEVYETDSLGYKDQKVISTDWDYFLAIHYDADIYNEGGGFVDYPDASADAVNQTSKTLARELSDYYFNTTKILNKPSRSNANTKFYYMWNYLTRKTPCVIIECGVGNRKPDDYIILRNYELISTTIAEGILKGLNVPVITPCDHTRCTKDLVEMTKNKEEWKEKARNLEEEVKKLKDDIKIKDSNYQKAIELCGILEERANNLVAREFAANNRSKALEKEVSTISSRLEDVLKSNVELRTENKALQQQITEGYKTFSDILPIFSTWFNKFKGNKNGNTIK